MDGITTQQLYSSLNLHLICHAGAFDGAHSATGNSIAQDTTYLVAATSSYVLGCQNVDVTDEIDENEIQALSSNQSILIENVLVYIAGFVVKKSEKQITCEVCHPALVADNSFNGSFTLTNRRNEGGLKLLSAGVIAVLRSAEMNIRAMSKIDVANRKLSSLKLQSVVLEELGSKNLFDLQGHFLATGVGIENHYFDLVRKLVDIFFTVR